MLNDCGGDISLCRAVAGGEWHYHQKFRGHLERRSRTYIFLFKNANADNIFFSFQNNSGKSTTCGHLIFKQGGIPPREMEKLQAMAEEMGKSSFGFAYYLDTCKEERDRGVTIQCNTKEFYTDKYHYTIVDARVRGSPGRARG